LGLRDVATVIEPRGADEEENEEDDDALLGGRQNEDVEKTLHLAT
jgi:hypothetical protein